MACNPALCAGPDGVAAPVPFAGEQLLLSRDGVEFELDGLECVPAQQLLAPPTRRADGCRVSRRRCGQGLPAGKTLFKQARLYLSNVRLVLVCKGAAALHAFDAPLVRLRVCRLMSMTLTLPWQAYVRSERFNQPIFGANNLTGTVFQVRRFALSPEAQHR